MKTFKDVQVGNEVIVYDTYSHDYIEHTIKVTSMEMDSDFSTETNPNGIHFYGEDLNYDEDEDECISNVDEGNFVCFASDSDKLEIL